MISAKVIADSVGPNGVRLTSLVLTYPRFAHAEFMTHRAFSRNASSSRAIPVLKQIEMVRNNPAVPMVFTSNKPGMQGGEPLEAEAAELARTAWLQAAEAACQYARYFAEFKLHKQYANRVLEPFAHITVVVTATDWTNFFNLRWHKDALPEMQELAKQIYRAMTESEPRVLQPGMMHLPFIDESEYLEVLTKIEGGWLAKYAEDGNGLSWRLWDTWKPLIKLSVARCARVSYLRHDGTPSTVQEDEALYDRLTSSAPLHASPTEHQAMCQPRQIKQYFGNLRGWHQFRKTLYRENLDYFTPPDELPNNDQNATVSTGG